MSKEKTHVDWDTMVHVQEMANLRAENTRLREALERIERGWEADDDGSCRYCPIQPEGHEPNCPHVIARTALEAE